jgi:hypothetical protein
LFISCKEKKLLMCELVSRSTKNYSIDNYTTKNNTAKNTDLIPNSDDLMCMPPAYTDNISIAPVMLQNPVINKFMTPVSFVSIASTAEDNTDKTIQSVTSTASTLTSTLNKIPSVISSISEIQSNSALMLRVSKWAGPTAKVITDTKAFQVAGKFVGNPIVTKGAGTLGMISGAFEIKNGITKINKGNQDDGIFLMMDGTSNMVAGGALITGNAKVSSGAAAFGIGMSIGRFGDHSVRELNWLTDNKGKAESVSDRLGDKMWNVHEAVVKSTGNETLGTVTALGAGVIMLPAAGVVTVGGALINGGKQIDMGLISAWDYVFNKK